jgi:protein ImuB
MNQWVAADSAKRVASSLPGNAERPFWLLEKPIALMMRDDRPFYGSPLRMIRGPERIECGWWDGALAERDYFIAQGSDQACYWVYRERGGQTARWYLHGLFA